MTMIRQACAGIIAAVAATTLTACADDARERLDAEPPAGVPVAEPAGALVPDTAGAPPDLPAPAPAAQPDTTTAQVPVVARPSVRPQQATLTRVVFGTATVDVDSTTKAPADYYRVLLRSGSRTYETLTDRSGNFAFEDVPAGSYELVLVTVTKEERVVYSAPVAVSGAKAELPPIRVPLRAIRAPRQ